MSNQKNYSNSNSYGYGNGRNKKTVLSDWRILYH